ncbi:MAG: OprO/OprP family phosphate-selective porin [Caulobacteraceae bacterium]
MRHAFPTRRLAFRRLTRAALIGALLSGAATAALAQAPLSTAPRSDAASASTDAKIEALEAELETLRSQLQDLKAATVAEIKDVRSNAAPKPSATVSISKGAPTFASADGAYTATLHGVLQFDAAAYSQQSPGPTTTDLRRGGPALGASASNVDLGHARNLKDGDLFRRARIGVDGAAPGGWEYRLLFDFGGSGVENAGQIYEGWVQYSGLKPLHFRVGAFAPSLGLEDANSTSYMPFLDRPSPVDISRNLAGGETRTGFQVAGYGPYWFASAAVTGRPVGVINTNNVIPVTASTTSITVGTAQTYSDALNFTGRLAYDPLHGKDWRINLGLHGSYVDRPANASGPGTNGATPISSSVVALNGTAELRVDGTKLINTGNIPAKHASTVGAEFAAQKGPFFLASEYEHIEVARSDIASTPQFNGYYVEGTWFLTGETKAYNQGNAAFDGPTTINHVFNPKAGGLGAVELAVRWSDMNLNHHAGSAGAAPAADAIRGGEQSIFTAGLNWYPSPIIRFMLDYQHVRIDRLSPSASAYATPAGAQIGQSYDSVALRSQIAF